MKISTDEINGLCFDGYVVESMTVDFVLKILQIKTDEAYLYLLVRANNWNMEFLEYLTARRNKSFK